MKIPIFMIFQFFGIISSWAVKALDDGKVTVQEGLELVIALCSLLGVKPEFDISDYTLKVDIAPDNKIQIENTADFLSTSDYQEPKNKPQA